MWVFYSVSMGLVLVIVVSMISRYAAPKVSILTLGVTTVAWLMSLSVLALVPLDVWAALSGRASARDAQVLGVLWTVSYWSTQGLTWAAIPVLQYYSLSGSFTILGRMRHALFRLWLFYAVVLALCVAGVLVALGSGRLRVRTLPTLLITLSNTYGLICIIVALGYGLVELPRILWRRTHPERRLAWHHHRVGRGAERLRAASTELQTAMAVSVASRQQIPRAESRRRARADQVLRYVERTCSVPLSAVADHPLDVERLTERDLDYAADERGLADLRGRVKMAISQFEGCRGEYCGDVRKALELEAVVKARQLGVYSQPPRALVSMRVGGRRQAWCLAYDDESQEGGPAASGARASWVRLLWLVRCTARPWALRLLSLACVALSGTVVWCEATIATGTSPDLSPWSLALRAAAEGPSFPAQLLAALPLVYMGACTYFSLILVGNFSFYHVVPGATWAYSLLLSGSLLCRFAAPLAFNYLHVVRLSSAQTVFSEKMARAMADVPLLGTSFNTWFPLVLVVYVLLLALNLWERCASKLFTTSRFRFDVERADDEHTASGAALVRAEAEALDAGGCLGDGLGVFGVGSVVRIGSGPAAARAADLELAKRSAAISASAARAERLAAGGGEGAGGPGELVPDWERAGTREERAIDSLFSRVEGRPSGRGLVEPQRGPRSDDPRWG